MQLWTDKDFMTLYWLSSGKFAVTSKLKIQDIEGAIFGAFSSTFQKH